MHKNVWKLKLPPTRVREKMCRAFHPYHMDFMSVDLLHTNIGKLNREKKNAKPSLPVSFVFGKLEIFVHYIFYKQWAHINKTRAFIHSNRPRQGWVWIILFWCFAGHFILNFRAQKSSIRCTTWPKCWWRQSCSCAHCDRRKQSMKQFCFQSKIAVQLLIRNIWSTKE